MKKAPATIPIDAAGRIVIPTELRRRFSLKGGERLEVRTDGETIELVPPQTAVRLMHVNGVLVYRGGEIPAGEDPVTAHREERIQDLAGSLRRRG